MPYTLTMPKLSPTMERGVIAKWCKKEGEFVKEGDTLLEVATDKATVEHNALDSGWLRQILAKEGSSAEVNDPIAIFTEKQNESLEGYVAEKVVVSKVKEAPDKPQQAAPAQTSSQNKPAARVFASPLARKIAEESGIDLSKVSGSGPSGRIVSKDLKQEKKTQPSGSYEKIPFSPVRSVIAKRLQESKSTIPHFYVTQKVSVQRLAEMRAELAFHGKNISYNDLIVKATSLSLEKHPVINSGCDGNSILRFATIDISIAVSTPTGLITPIVFNANHKDLFSLSSEIKTFAVKAKEGRLRPEEYQGGSFTISNLGMFGITEFQAIINPPQAAILAIGGIVEEPVIIEGRVVPGKTMNFTLSADHRVIDGADAALFLKTLKEMLENPSILFI